MHAADKPSSGAQVSRSPRCRQRPEQAADYAQLQRLSDAIEELAAVEPRLAQVVDLRYFSGFSLGDIAAMWGMSERTAQRDWEKARLFLHRLLSDPDGEAQPPASSTPID